MGESCSRLANCAVIEECQPGEASAQHLLEDCAGTGASKHKTKITAEGIGLSAFAKHGIEVGMSYDAAMQFSSASFGVCRRGPSYQVDEESTSATAQGRQSWRQRYRIGKDIGSGQTAVVYEGFMRDPATHHLDRSDVEETRSTVAETQASAGRRVAIKVFHQANSVMFQQEQFAFMRVGPHPYILRLLESYQGFGDKDVLIMEYCEGGDVYDLYARCGGSPMDEVYVAQLLRQLLLALHHLERIGIEHRDVKPENLLLCGTKGSNPPEAPRRASPNNGSGNGQRASHYVKLADFGWSIIASHGERPALPPDGVGSLWYAPPELNPPVPGMKSHAPAPLGRSDMWSAGVICYLLLVGHNPFNLALRFKDPKLKEAEVLRLAAKGDFNDTARGWGLLSSQAQSFVRGLIQPEPNQRMSALEALSHPFFMAVHQLGAANSTPQFSLDRSMRWDSLEGLQRLSWLAVARAASESELLKEDTFRRLLSELDVDCTKYLEQVAAELVLQVSPAWFEPASTWGDIFALAFRYLDVDGDGRLNLQDVLAHLQDSTQPQVLSMWMAKWRQHLKHLEVDAVTQSVGFDAFREVLRSVLESIQPEEDIWLESSNERHAKERLRDIAEGCVMFMNEEENLLSLLEVPVAGSAI